MNRRDFIKGSAVCLAITLLPDLSSNPISIPQENIIWFSESCHWSEICVAYESIDEKERIRLIVVGKHAKTFLEGLRSKGFHVLPGVLIGTRKPFVGLSPVGYYSL
jgi:hypothetical protein